MWIGYQSYFYQYVIIYLFLMVANVSMFAINLSDILILLTCILNQDKDSGKIKYKYKLDRHGCFSSQFVSYIVSIDLHQRSQNLRHLYPGMGLKLEIFGFFFLIKITMVRKVHMSLHLLQSETFVTFYWLLVAKYTIFGQLWIKFNFAFTL